MNAVWNGFHSPLARHIEQYLATKRALGCKFGSEDRTLRLLDRFLSEQGVKSLEAVTGACLEQFTASRERINARGFNHLLGVVRRLFDWIVSQNLLAVSPLQVRSRRETARRLPFLFDADAIRRLLAAADQRPPRLNHTVTKSYLGTPIIVASQAGAARQPLTVTVLWRPIARPLQTEEQDFVSRCPQKGG